MNRNFHDFTENFPSIHLLIIIRTGFLKNLFEITVGKNAIIEDNIKNNIKIYLITLFTVFFIMPFYNKTLYCRLIKLYKLDCFPTI